jgi:aminopeptidase-like protein
VIFTTTMPASIRFETLDQSVSAFTPDGKLVMNYGRPCVAWGFSITDLEEWLTTIEETINDIPPAHRWALERLYFSLKGAHEQHKREHEAVVTDAPSSDDLMSYLASYAAAMAYEAMEARK